MNYLPVIQALGPVIVSLAGVGLAAAHVRNSSNITQRLAGLVSDMSAALASSTPATVTARLITAAPTLVADGASLADAITSATNSTPAVPGGAAAAA